MVAVQALEEPQRWSQPSPDDDGGLVEIVRPARVRRLPDRATRIRRRRLVVLVLVVVAAAVAFSLTKAVVTAGSSRIIDESPASPITDAVYVVQPGDTLWSIAQRLAPDADPRPLVEELRDLNGGSKLEVGTRLAVDEI
jgi:hypothetical protein